ncbi:MAG: ferredoxin-thioredoxin reductase catalytic domain-containing protein [Candidatus Woesearchaeota archaeon]
MKTKEELKEYLENYATKNNFVLNPNEKVREIIIFGLFKNKELYGEIYCPCRKRTGNKEEDKKIICPCIYHKDEILKDGRCHCMLFFSKN